MPSVLQPWVHGLSMMQQSVLLAAVRGPDTLPKEHAAKSLLRWYRRCFLISAFEKKIFTNAYEEGGGSFTGPLRPPPYPAFGAPMDGLEYVTDEYLRSVDAVPHHFHLHLMHASEILGYKHPKDGIAQWWMRFYFRCANDMHLTAETQEAMEKRLGDSEADWRAAEEVTARR